MSATMDQQSALDQQSATIEELSRYDYGWRDADSAGANARRGLNEDVVRDISSKKNEPEWMLDLRLKGLRLFDKKPMPQWGSELGGIDFDTIKYFVRSTEKQANSWEDLPADIKNTYDRLGIPEAEKQRLVAGVAAQYESEVVYHKIREDLEELGVIFLDTDTGLKEHEDIFREYFGSVIPVGDNKFAALNTAVWSGGSFIYVPPGVHVDIPLQAYFRINTENMGQFERTLIIVDEDAYVHYVEGCTAPIYSSDSLHSAVVEIIVRKGGRCRYTTIQNWSTNVYNLVTKRAVAHAGATMEWVDGNLGSKVTMKYPAVWLTGEHAKGETLSIAFAGANQHQDAGAKMVHAAPRTSSTIISKSVARGGGRTSYRGLVQVLEGAHGSKSTVKCDALLVDDISRSDTYPYVDVREDDVAMGHEATVSKVSADQLFYLMSRGLSEDEAMAMIVRGFIEPIARELPMEYALELNRLIELQMEGAVG
ncbi:MAG: Fe-S cluster assembly protein SufB [Actinomycetales bacterium]|nr:Fe-S cluster assembly protein SufB [Actinomycetales bacterium]